MYPHGEVSGIRDIVAWFRNAGYIVNAENSFRITRKTRFLKKAGFPDLSGKNCYHIEILH
jgi:hypothetical protein